MSDRSEKVASLNDSFRAALLIGLAGGIAEGKYHITRGMQAAFGPNEMMQVFQKVVTFDKFTTDNDPYGEHDFGSIDHGGENIFHLTMTESRERIKRTIRKHFTATQGSYQRSLGS